MKSPCIRACTLTPDGKQCTGCKRTAEEISCWTLYTDEEREAIMARCKANVWGTKCQDCMSSLRADRKNQFRNELESLPPSPF
jgi:predicted Fe-S protein YdhL (DUF1289 family)